MMQKPKNDILKEIVEKIFLDLKQKLNQKHSILLKLKKISNQLS
jgi:hypothetical protein